MHGLNQTPSGQQAVKRIRRYVEMRDANPLIGLSDVVHAIHGPPPDGAELLLSDLRVLVRTAAPTAPSTAAGEITDAMVEIALTEFAEGEVGANWVPAEREAMRRALAAALAASQEQRRG